MPPSTLTQEQLEDAARLKKVFTRWQLQQREAGLPSSQGAVSEYLGFNQSAVNQYLNGRIPLNVAAATKFAGLLNVGVQEFSPTLGEEVLKIVNATYGAGRRDALEAGAVTKGGPTVFAFDPDDALPDDFVLVPESRIEFSAGNGRNAVFEQVEDAKPALYRREWLSKQGLKPERLRRFPVHGDSQEPMLYHGDTVLVNLDETNVVDGRLYAIRYDNDLRIKFLFRKLDGTLILRSINPAYPDEEVNPNLANEHISIIGRVRDRSGNGGL